MHDDRRLLEGRLARFTADHLTRAVHRASVPLSLEAWPVPDEPVPFAEAVTKQYEPIPAGMPWGRPWSTLWIHVTGEVPADWAGVEGTGPEVLVDLGFTAQPGFQGEGLAWRPDGTTIKARLAAEQPHPRGPWPEDRHLSRVRGQPGRREHRLPSHPERRPGDDGRGPDLRARANRRGAARPRGLGAVRGHLDAWPG